MGKLKTSMNKMRVILRAAVVMDVWVFRTVTDGCLGVQDCDCDGCLGVQDCDCDGCLGVQDCDCDGYFLCLGL